jgi:hypothetical protein
MTSKKKMDKPTQTPQNDPKNKKIKKLQYPFRPILYRKSSQNSPNQTKIKKSSLKIILTQLPIT